MKNMNILITTNSATVIVEGEPYTVHKDHKRYDDLIAAYRAKDMQALKRVIDALNEVKTWSDERAGGKIKVVGGAVYYAGERMDNVVTERILAWVYDDLDPQPMINFLERLLNNPSYQSREELLLFLEHSELPIQEDGRFLAYKRVRDNYKDCHSGKFDNSVGQTVEMPRSQVNDNRSQTCSAGLHFCSKEYLNHFYGEKVMLLAIDPADVVSIPNDYNNAKGRCCRYEVIEEVGGEVDFKSPLYTSSNEKAVQERTRTGRFLSRDNVYKIRAVDGDGDVAFLDVDYDGLNFDGVYNSVEDALFSTYGKALEIIENIDDYLDLEGEAPLPITLTIVDHKGNEYDSEEFEV